MMKKGLLAILVLALLLPLAAMSVFAEAPDAAAEREARAEALGMLADLREEGILFGAMQEGVTPEDALALLAAYGEPRLSEVFLPDDVWFTVSVPEDRILDALVELTLNEAVDWIYPNYIILMDDMLLLGDIDFDEEVTPLDYMLIKRAVLGTYQLEEKAATVADMDGNGTVDATDYMLVKRTVLGTCYLGWVEVPVKVENTTWCVNQYTSYSDEALYERIDQELADGEGIATLTIAFAHIKEEEDGAALLEELGFSGDLSDEAVYPQVRHETSRFLLVEMTLPAEQLREAMFTLRRCEEIFECALGSLYAPE